MNLKRKNISRTVLFFIIFCVSITPFVIAQDHPDDIYWDRGFGRQSGTSAGEIVYDMVVYNNLPIACGRLSLHRGDLEIFNILSWDGLEYLPLDTGVSFYGRSMVGYRNKLIVGGHSYNGISIAEWDGASWSTLDTGLVGNIEAMTVIDDSLFVAGWLQTASNAYAWSIAVWDGSQWGKLDGTFNGKINSLTEFNNQLVVGGDFTHVDLQSISLLARRDNNSWDDFYYSLGTSITDMVVWNNMLVIAGDLKNNNKVGLLNSLDSLTFLPQSDSIDIVDDLILYKNQITVSTTYYDSLLTDATILTWNGTGWESIGDNLLGTDLSIAQWGSSLFVFGRTRIKGQLYTHRSALWNGNEWALNLENGLFWSTYESVLFQNQIVVGGNFDYVGNETSDQIGLYDGDKWTALGYSDAGNVAALYSYDDTLYAGGWFSEIGGISAICAVKYDGTNWTDIGFTAMCNPHDFIHYNNKLIVGGSYLVINSDTVTLAYRENNQWIPFDDQPNDVVSSFAIYKNNLIVTGGFDSIGTTPAKNIAMWDGTNWTALATSTDRSNSYLGRMVIINDTLRVTGYFKEIDGVTATGLAFWDGNNWSSIGSGQIVNEGQYIKSIIGYNDQLIIGGMFDSIGGVAANNIAIWDGTTFSHLGSGITSYPGWYSPPSVGKFQVFQDELYVFGEFFMAGGIESHNIARWTKYNVATDIADEENRPTLPNDYALHQNYPNPFNPTTEISFTLPKNSNVTLEVFNILGQKVSTLVDRYKPVGTHTVTWDASDFSSGMYIYRLSTDEFTTEKKMVLIK